MLETRHMRVLHRVDGCSAWQEKLNTHRTLSLFNPSSMSSRSALAVARYMPALAEAEWNAFDASCGDAVRAGRQCL